jgi:hypothetical protein
MLRRRLAALLLASILTPATALADIGDAEKSVARDLTIQGNDLLNAHDYAGAADRFSRADKLFRAASVPVPPTITLGLARAHAALGKLLSAQELYSRILHETIPPNASPALVSAVEAAQREMPALAARVPGVVINVKGTDAARVFIDGADVPSAIWGLRRPADPGRHVVHASAPGFTSMEAVVTLAEGRTETVNLELKPGSGGPPPPAAPVDRSPAGPTASAPSPSAPPAGPNKDVMITGAAMAGASAVAGAIFAGLWASKGSIAKSDAAKQVTSSVACPVGGVGATGNCANIISALNSQATFGSAAVGTFVAAGAVGAATLIYGLASGRRAPKAGFVVSPTFGAQGGGLMVGGSF